MNVKKATPTKKGQMGSPLKVTSLGDIDKINPNQFAKQLLEEQKRKKGQPSTSNATMPRLQQQLQNPPPIQQNLM